MTYQDPPRRQRPPRYPVLAQYEDSYQSSQSSQSYPDTQAGYPSGNGYQENYRGFAGLAGAPRQAAPWDTSWDQPSAWEQPTQQGQVNEWGQPTEWAQQTEWGQPAEWGQPTEREPQRRTSGPFFADGGDGAPADDDRRPRRTGMRGQLAGRGRLAGAVAGFLAAAVAIGVANLVAAFVRPQASPIIAVGGAFIDRTPSWLKNFAVEKFGENDKNMLLLGMYVTLAVIAIVIGVLAWRRVAIGVAGVGLFGLFGAFVAITRPESQVTDVIPSLVGGVAGIAAIVWLVRIGTAMDWRSRGQRAGGGF